MKYIMKLAIPILLAALMLGPIGVSGEEMAGFNCLKFEDQTLNVSDGEISPAWQDVKSYQNISEYGTQGMAQFATNSTYLFVHLKVDASLNWVAIEFQSEKGVYMTKGHDAWTFYINDPSEQVNSVDVTMEGMGVPDTDPTNDLHTEAVFNEGTVDIEIARPFTGSDANDVNFQNGTVYTLTFASSNTHFNVNNVYYLNILYVDNPDVVITEPVIVDNSVDWTAIKTTALYIALGVSALFVLTHFLVRVVFRPLKKESRIVGPEYKAPTFQDRWQLITSIFKKETTN
jgi:hypothetical protein